MAASKNKKTASGGAQNHIRARLAYLHRASTYLLKREACLTTSESENATSAQNTAQSQTPCQTSKELEQTQEQATLPPQQACISRHYVSQMRGISLKAQQRLSIETKRTFCKRCDLLLVPGVTSTEEICNASKGRKKPWADVLVIRCSACETEKRIPQNKMRSKKLKDRQQEKKNKETQDQAGVS